MDTQICLVYFLKRMGESLAKILKLQCFCNQHDKGMISSI